MEPLGIEPRLITIIAADIVGYNRLMSADEAGMIFAINNAFDLMHAGESIRSVIVFD